MHFPLLVIGAENEGKMIEMLEPFRETDDGPGNKWDWYEVGGRFSWFFISKEKKASNVAQYGDLDFKEMEIRNIAEAGRRWEKYEAYAHPHGADVFGVRDGDTKESFIERGKPICLFAVLKNGVWHERGCVNGVLESAEDWQKKFDALLSDLSLDTWLVVVDCHI